MPGRDYATPFVQSALRQGVGPTAALREARSQGLRIGTSIWFQTYNVERNNLALRSSALDLPLNRRPTPDEIGQIVTVRRKGFLYRVVGALQDDETGAFKTTVVSVKTDKLITRGAAIQMAMDSFQDPDNIYPNTLLGAFTAGVFEMTPGEDLEDDTDI